MYIKQIIIQGFKSYKDQTVIEPFSPGTNVIVGRNGSGKSNFFAAIRFVLSDAYTQMSREERQALLHEGSGSAVMSAYVEIIFDNSDERFPVTGKEVTIRRTIALKKDEYSVDRKVTPKAEVMSLLESAGFSRSNPYYIVPQGRVTALTNMKESDRLNLLKEVAGTQVYESRRAESLKIMTETNNKRGKIDELLKYITDRLEELEEEKEELRGYQEKDRERRCLEYAHYHHEQEAINEALEEIESSRQGGSENSNQDREAFQRGEQAIAEMEEEMHNLEQQRQMLSIDKRQAAEDRRDAGKALGLSELKAQTLAEGKSGRDQAKKQHENDLREVRQQIAAKEAELAKITPEYKKLKDRELAARQRLDQAEGSRNRLEAKQSRSSRFKNKAERDKHLETEIQELDSSLGHQKANLMQAHEDVKTLELSIKQLEKETSTLRDRLENWGGTRGAVEEEIGAKKDELDQLSEERRRLNREDDKLSSVLRNARSELSSAQKALSSMVDRPAFQGLETIRRLKKERNIAGAYGTVAELMQVNPAYSVAAEQVAGASLFHYIVDTADTASMLVGLLSKLHGGKATFMPLDKLRPKSPKLPRAADAVPLKSKIQYDPKYEVAFEQIFGKTIVCPNMQIAGQYARSSQGINAITPEGDTTNKRGAMTGGWIDPTKSRLESVARVSKWQAEVFKLEEQSREYQRELERKDQEFTTAIGEYQKLEGRLRQAQDGYEPLRAELLNKTTHLTRQKENLETAHKRRDAVDKTMKDFGETIDAYRAEMKTDFKKALTADEERQLLELGKNLTELGKAWNEAAKARRALDAQKQNLEVDLRENLHPRLDQLNSQAFENASSTSGGGSVAEAEKELKKASKAYAKADKAFETIEKQLENLAAQVVELEGQKRGKEGEQQELAARIERAQKRQEKNLQKKGILTTQAAQTAKSIRDLGVLPDEAFGKYERMEPKTIASRLKKVNDALKKYKHVNKKAFDQYNSFTAQQDALLKRRQELDSSQKSIEDLVAHLDRVKDESIERTFKQVSKEFATIFERLVPAGHGRLVIQRRADKRLDPDDSDEEQRTSVENYTGVGISVSFNSKHMDEQQRIQQLSGGQKSLCALCLIFALQQTESSPMVIFDEVDANLDAQYRTAVAGLLDSISREAGTQFICTTFRPEIVHIANKCYGVTFRNKTSSIDCVPTEEALNFVEGQQKRA